jgi:predicted Holliday junction resolvase-like endonuclease
MKYVLLGLSIVIVVLIIVVVILSLVIANQNQTIQLLQTNVRDMKTIEGEYREKKAIYERQDKAFTDLKNAKTLQDRIKVMKNIGLVK